MAIDWRTFITECLENWAETLAIHQIEQNNTILSLRLDTESLVSFSNSIFSAQNIAESICVHS